MKRVCLIAVLLAVSFGTAMDVMAQQGLTISGANADDQKKRLADQKIRLLETLLSSPAAKSAAYGVEVDSPPLVDYGQKMIARARQEVAEARYDEAGKTLDEVMKTVSKATRRASSDTAFSDSAQRKTYSDLSEQLATYRQTIQDLTHDVKLKDAARRLLGEIDAATANSAQLSAAGRWGEANKELAEMYKRLTEQIAQMRQGHEVVLSLKFASPADEFAYEEKRFSSHQIMVDMMIADGKADGDRRRLVDPVLVEAARLKREAFQQASGGNYLEAVRSMERANSQLVRALQAMGVPVF